MTAAPSNTFASHDGGSSELGEPNHPIKSDLLLGRRSLLGEREPESKSGFHEQRTPPDHLYELDKR